VSTTVRKEGFWYSKYEPSLPMPEPRTIKTGLHKYSLVARLKRVQGDARVSHMRGFSTCRLCGTINGSAQYDWNGWVWPEGLLHYIQEHDVAPSEDFQDWLGDLYD